MDRRTFTMVGIMLGLAAAFRAVAKAGESGLTVQIRNIDVKERTAHLTLIVMPSETWFGVEGNVEGLKEGQIVKMQIEKQSAKLEGRELAIKRISFIP